MFEKNHMHLKQRYYDTASFRYPFLNEAVAEKMVRFLRVLGRGQDLRRHVRKECKECEVARTDKSYSEPVLVYISGSLPESSRTNPTPDNFVFHTII